MTNPLNNNSISALHFAKGRHQPNEPAQTSVQQDKTSTERPKKDAPEPQLDLTNGPFNEGRPHRANILTDATAANRALNTLAESIGAHPTAAATLYKGLNASSVEALLNSPTN